MSDIPPLEDDRTAMMLGMVPDKRTPEERLLDAVDTGGASLNYRQDSLGDSDGGTAAGPPVAGFDDGLSALIAAVMRAAAVDYPTARAAVHALNSAGYLR